MAPSGRRGPEHNLVRLPLVDQLIGLGWSEGQLQYEPEWLVPKNPSQASKREAGQRYDGFPVDVVLFDTDATAGDWEHVLAIFELKAPTIEAGKSQLEIYLGLEPRARFGFWTNGSMTLGLYRRADGKFKEVGDCLLPTPTDNLSEAAEKPLIWSDLKELDVKTLRSKLDRLLGTVVAGDSKSTRSDERLNQLCNMLLLKLESDKTGKFEPDRPLQFQVLESEDRTASQVQTSFSTFRATHGALFEGETNQGVRLDAHTIHQVVYELSRMKLMDTPIEVVSQAFQVFRAANLKSGEGQYFTPSQIVRAAVEFLDIAYDDKVIDPACGTGGFLLETFKVLKAKYPDLPDADLRTWAHTRLYGVDKDDINVKLTKAIMAILGDGSANVHAGDSLRAYRWERDYPSLTQALKDDSFTCVITNPPLWREIEGHGARLAQIGIHDFLGGSRARVQRPRRPGNRLGLPRTLPPATHERRALGNSVTRNLLLLEEVRLARRVAEWSLRTQGDAERAHGVVPGLLSRQDELLRLREGVTCTDLRGSKTGTWSYQRRVPAGSTRTATTSGSSMSRPACELASSTMSWTTTLPPFSGGRSGTRFR